MDEPPVADPEPDLAVLERTERELFAVEAALTRIDEGVYDELPGLDP